MNNTYFVNLYLKIDAITGEKSTIVGDPKKKEETAIREMWGNYKKLHTVSVSLTEAEYISLTE